MYSASNQLESALMAADRNAVLAGVLDRSTIVRVQQPEGGPTAMVCRRAAGEASEVRQTPGDSVALRFFAGRCHLWVNVGSQWHDCGEAGEGMVHVSRPNQLVRTEWLSDGEELVLTVPHSYWHDRVTQGMRAALAMGKPCRHADPVLRQLVNVLMQSALEDLHVSFAAPLIDALLARVVMLCRGNTLQGSRRNALPAFRIRRVARYVREHLSETITLADMAAAAGMSSMHFAALFRQATGQRPHHYLLEQRILHAKELMLRTSRSLCEIALSAGFSTQAHFCTVFKRFAGTTPHQWRSSYMR
ncbi:helix-turn-helix domain-containing protein [Dyella flava]|uniref:Helix-turn-helix transcriptional regulator n=1 Tax=Dyella flava TaxID=1920170 RepID=A0ABS2JXZ0_9GAMM|nr:AraC family transcriptional regulator [Dyella flava]MBM7123862.1 helix-turn-helix transcriptional regulator [Dyella flava]GLQ52598.1 hypothetical protein GCM10010872_40470 [Dyella flava]